MKCFMRSTAAALAIASSIWSVPAAAQVTVGTPTAGNGNCLPIGCANGFSRYQQVYTASAFSGPISIGSLTFFHTAFQPGLGVVAPGTYDIFFGTTTKSVNGLSTTYGNNYTTAPSLFANLTVPINTSSAATTFTINGVTPFLYNPAAGNLLLDIVYNNFGGGIETFFDADLSGSGQVSRAYGTGLTGFTDNVGLVTGFNTRVAVTTAPEPASLVLFGAGLVATVAFVRRRRTA